MKITCWMCGGPLYTLHKFGRRWTFCFGCDTKTIPRPDASMPAEIVGPPVVVREMLRRAEA